MSIRITFAKAGILVAALALGALLPAAAAAQQPGGTGNCCAEDPDLWPEDPNTTRLLFGPTARTLPRGGVSLGIHGYVLLSVQVGLTDRVSFGGGTPLIFGFGGGADRPFWITPKIQLVRHRRADVAVGVVHALNVDGGMGMAYAVMTSGTARGSMTAGGVLGYTSGGGRSLVIMVGGDRQVRPRMKFVTENYYRGSQGVVSAGVRFFDDHKSLDAALAAPINGYFYGLVPMLNFTYRF